MARPRHKKDSVPQLSIIVTNTTINFPSTLLYCHSRHQQPTWPFTTVAYNRNNNGISRNWQSITDVRPETHPSNHCHHDMFHVGFSHENAVVAIHCIDQHIFAFIRRGLFIRQVAQEAMMDNETNAIVKPTILTTWITIQRLLFNEGSQIACKKVSLWRNFL
jgi:hypothetical protein